MTAVDPPQFQLLADGVVILPLEVDLPAVLVDLHLLPKGVEDGEVGEGHQRHHQQDAEQAGGVRHLRPHRHAGGHDKEVVDRPDGGEGPPAPALLFLQLQVGTAEIPPEDEFHQRKEDKAAHQQHQIGAPGQPVQEVGGL